MSINRVWQLARPNNPPPYAFTATTLILFTLSGLFNVVLFTFTRPTLIPHADSDHEAPCAQPTDISTLAFRALTEEDLENEPRFCAPKTENKVFDLNVPVEVHGSQKSFHTNP